MNTIIRQFNDLKLVKKLWLSFAFVSLVTLVTFALLSSTFIRNMIIQREGNVIQQRIESYTGSLDNYLQSIEKSSQVLIYSQRIQERFKGNMNLLNGEERINAYNDVYSQMRQMWDNVYGLEAIYLVDRYQNVFDTNVRLSMNPGYLTSEDFVNQGWYELAHKSGGAPYWSFIKWKGKETSIVLFKAIYDRNDLSLIGYLVVAISPQIFDTFLSSSNLSDGTSSVADAKGFVYATGGKSGSIIQAVDARDFANTKGYLIQQYEGDSYMVAYAKYPMTNWVFVHSIKLNVLLKDLSRVNTLWIFFLFLSLLIMILVSTFIARTISMPIRKMVKLIRDVERGNLMAKFQAQYKDEFGTLGHAYNNMLDTIREGVPLIREKFFRSLLERSMSDEQLQEYERRLDFRFQNDEFQVALVYIHGLSKEETATEAESLIFNYESRCPVLSTSVSADQFCLIFNCPQESVLPFLEELLQELRGNLSLNAYAFVGNAYDHVNFVKTSYEEAKTLMKYAVRDRMDGDAVIYRSSDSLQTQYPESFENRLVFYMDESDYEQCVSVVNELLEYAKTNHLAPYIMTTFLVAMYHYLYKQVMKYGSIHERASLDLFRNLDSRLSVEPLEKSCRDFLLLLHAHIGTAPDKHNMRSPNVMKSVDLIHKQYHLSDLSVEYVARYLGLTANYFSQLFKKEVGIGFVDYVGGVRLEEAKKMLIDSNVKVKEVAESVGFVDPHYFGIWFKENTGLSPSQYRKTMWINKLEA
jgi:YesN/AraC family two-component response regulator